NFDRCNGFVIRPIYVASNAGAPEAVDLGLSVKWANMNLGATSPEDAGEYYGWGCTEPYATTDNVTWTLYFSKLGSTGTSASDCGTDKDPLKAYVTNKTGIEGSAWDVAHCRFGGGWRMPTKAELDELMAYANCSWQWMDDYNGVKGFMVTSKMLGFEGNCIFIPMSGYMIGSSLVTGESNYSWTGTPFTRTSQAWSQAADEENGKIIYSLDRYFGLTIRPVCD
ncbi:MAG: hypothetical protein HUK01_09135, partial [Bacteroidaceae bacterium]|nr:hypothetical protein [Bacteroidaceae bacterium]